MHYCHCCIQFFKSYKIVNMCSWKPIFKTLEIKSVKVIFLPLLCKQLLFLFFHFQKTFVEALHILQLGCSYVNLFFYKKGINNNKKKWISNLVAVKRGNGTLTFHIKIDFITILWVSLSNIYILSISFYCCDFNTA